ncbi:hypothetical protein MYO4S_00097 [Serratia phage 4S]|nr:hypothetical protein MYO4S_00097 [Serratia phage 4S]
MITIRVKFKENATPGFINNNGYNATLLQHIRLNHMGLDGVFSVSRPNDNSVWRLSDSDGTDGRYFSHEEIIEFFDIVSSDDPEVKSDMPGVRVVKEILLGDFVINKDNAVEIKKLIEETFNV